MEKSLTYYNDLIIRYLSGEASPEEIGELSNWLGESEGHQQIFSQLRKIWFEIEKQAIDTKIDLDQEWATLSKKCFEEEQSATVTIQHDFHPSKTRRMVRRWTAVAAIVLVTVISIVVIRNYTPKSERIEIIATTENLEQQLPDGSRVTLAPGASFQYQERFASDVRSVSLQGEAYFEVSHDASAPFIVSAGENIRVEVLGTTFYVNTQNDTHCVEVALITGRVAVYHKDRPGQKLILEPGEKTCFSESGKAENKQVVPDQNFLAWKTGLLVFSETRLDEVVNMLNRTYHSEVKLDNPSLGNCTITATFKDQTLESVIKVITETLSLKLSKKGSTYLISGNGCGE